MFAFGKKQRSGEGVCAMAGIQCPRTGDRSEPVYCRWWQTTVEQVAGQGDRVHQGCVIDRIPDWLGAVATNAARPAAAIESTRNEILRRIDTGQQHADILADVLAAGVGTLVSVEIGRQLAEPVRGESERQLAEENPEGEQHG